MLISIHLMLICSSSVLWHGICFVPITRKVSQGHRRCPRGQGSRDGAEEICQLQLVAAGVNELFTAFKRTPCLAASQLCGRHKGELQAMVHTCMAHVNLRPCDETLIDDLPLVAHITATPSQ